KYLEDVLTPGVRLAMFGKVELDRRQGAPVMVQLEFEILAEDEEDEGLHTGRVVPIYEAVSRISTKMFRVLLHRILQETELPSDVVPEDIRRRLALPDLAVALHQVHAPDADS